MFNRTRDCPCKAENASYEGVMSHISGLCLIGVSHDSREGSHVSDE